MERTRKGEEFAITLHGEEVGKLMPAKGLSLSDVQNAINEMKSRRITWNPSGKPKLLIKDLVNEWLATLDAELQAGAKAEKVEVFAAE